MKANIGKFDKNIRLILGFVIIILGLIFEKWWGLLGLIPLITGLVNWCPLYAPFNFSTIKEDQEQ